MYLALEDALKATTIDYSLLTLSKQVIPISSGAASSNNNNNNNSNSTNISNRSSQLNEKFVIKVRKTNEIVFTFPDVPLLKVEYCDIHQDEQSKKEFDKKFTNRTWSAGGTVSVILSYNLFYFLILFF